MVKTPRTDFIRDLQNQYAKDDGWLGPKHLSWDVSRGSDFRGIANAVCCMDSFANLKTLMSMPQLEKWLSVDEPMKPSTQKAVEDSFRLFAEIVQDKKLSKILQTPVKISPVEFIGICILIYAFREKATLAQLAAGISEMRSDVRDQHVDVRMNSRVSKTIVDFVKKWSPTKISGDKGAVASTLKSGSTKRKRSKKVTDDDEEDEEAVHRVQRGDRRRRVTQRDEDRLEDELAEHDGRGDRLPSAEAAHQRRDDQDDREQGQRVSEVAVRGKDR